MLHFPDPFFIHVLFVFLMATIVGSTGWGVVGRCVGIENPDIKKCTFRPTPQKPLARMSRRAPLSVVSVERFATDAVGGQPLQGPPMSQ